MQADDDALKQLTFMPSRIPALDALEVFVPDGAHPDAEILELQHRTGQSRWYPTEGGHRLLILFEGGPFNAERFTLLKGAWDHEHCTRCGSTIEPMTLCWVTESEPFALLDEDCHQELFGANAGQ
jgi:hypothetical protein